MPIAGRTLDLQALDAAVAAACPRVVVIEIYAKLGISSRGQLAARR